jgi:hypothetical protein
MAQLEREGLPAGEDPQQAAELAWLKENIAAFWPLAYDGYCDRGRGTVVIDSIQEPLGEETPFYYAPQASIEAQQDEVSQQLLELIVTYSPDTQFVAVIIRQPEVEYEFSMYQIGVGEGLVEAVKAYDDPDYRPKPPSTEPEAEPKLEPPDLETLIEWESQGGCEAACPFGCWVECDGRCSHGNPSWLIVMGLI